MGPPRITFPPAQLCACDFPQYSKVERRPVTALEKMMESSFAGPQAFPEVPSPDRGSQSVKHHRYRQPANHGGHGHSVDIHTVYDWTTHAKDWQHCSGEMIVFTSPI